jgi:L-rhamnonate dehydratase
MEYRMNITSVSLFEVQMKWEGPDIPTEDRQVVPMDLYPQFNHHFSFSSKVGSILNLLFVEIRTEEGIQGIYGPIDNQQGFIIETLLAPFLKGKDALAIEALHDQMLRMHRHGRSGFFLTALSAVNLALWDLKGKALNLPVYRLMGGPTRPAVPAYASMLGASIEPARAAARAEAMKAEGYPAQKWFFRYGPGSGQEGLEKNLAMAFAVREAVGPHYPIAFDAYNGWTEPYAVEILRKLEPLNPLWVEEVIPPERVDSWAKIRSASRVPLATGEHVYTRWQVKELLVNGAVDYVQTDPDWTGGITEQVKICDLASSFDIPVIAHGHSLMPALHIAAAQSPAVVPMVEYLVNLQSVKQVLFIDMVAPVQGQLPLPAMPGLGLVIDESKIEGRQALSWQAHS